MSRCELALEEDALITSEQLEPQGTLWTLKKKAQTIHQNTRNYLAGKNNTAELPNSNMH
jgi:hypothetical protein